MPPVITAPAETEMPAKAVISRLWIQYLRPQKASLAVAVFSAVVVALSTAAFVWWLHPAIDLLFRAPLNDTTALLPAVLRAHPMLAVPGVTILIAIIRFAGQRGVTKTLNKVGRLCAGSTRS